MDFTVLNYSDDSLENLFQEVATVPLSLIRKTSHNDYFKYYLKDIGAKTLVVEKDYIDRDFLEDFSGYYVRCFAPYKRKCWRLHFFSFQFTPEDFENLLSGNTSRISETILRDNYLGFLVAKPLPQTIVGRTCIKPYPGDSGRRNFPTVRPYTVHLYGINLNITSLAFQEQDTVTSACATSALWTVFHATGKLFHHPILSPVEITRAATDRLPILSRVIPNKGLQGEHLAHAIRSIKLEPLYAGYKDEHILKSTIYAYLRSGIPLVLGIILVDTTNSPGRSAGRHAVAVTGYSIGNSVAKPYGVSNFNLMASKIDKLYVHDDQVGPFAKMEFLNEAQLDYMDQESGNLSNPKTYHLSTSWKATDSTVGKVIAIPVLTLIPLYHKIRIPFETVHKVIVGFDIFMDNVLRQPGKMPASLTSPIEWDIYLTSVNDLKEDLFSSKKIVGNYLKLILIKDMPKYIWRATAFCGGVEVVDLLFDATDIEQGTYFICAIEYDVGLSRILRSISKDDNLKQKYETEPEWRIINWFRDPSLPEYKPPPPPTPPTI